MSIESRTGALLLTWQWALSQRIAGKALHGQGREVVETVENFHGLLHSFTFVALGADVNW